MANTKPKSKLNKKEKLKYDREREKAALLINYKEGISNIDYDKLPLPLPIEIPSEFTVADLEKVIGRPVPLISKTEWLKREIAKLEENRPKVPPSYKLQDPVDERAKYRQKFVEGMRKTKPDILDDLRQFTEKFENLFGRSDGYKFLYKLQDVRYEMMKPYSSFVDTSDLQNKSFYWGRFTKLFVLLSAYDFYHRRENALEELPDVRQLIESIKYKLQTAKQIIVKTFQETAKDKNSILRDFVDLQLGILSWCKTYNLEKDWLFDYAYFFIKQFSDDRDIKVEELKVEKRFYESNLQFVDFNFNSPGWNMSAEGESVVSYTKRITQEFEDSLKKYISDATGILDLHKFDKITKPPTYESVEWFSFMFFRNLDVEKIVEKFYPNIAASRTNNASCQKAFESKVNHINNQIAKLKNYDFPERLNRDNTYS